MLIDDLKECQEGGQAYADGLGISDNPYVDTNDIAAAHWHIGYVTALSHKEALRVFSKVQILVNAAAAMASHDHEVAYHLIDMAHTITRGEMK